LRLSRDPTTGPTNKRNTILILMEIMEVVKKFVFCLFLNSMPAVEVLVVSILGEIWGDPLDWSTGDLS